MSKNDLILIGAGGHARACIDVIEQHGQYQIAGFVESADQKHSKQLGYGVIASDNELEALAKSYQYALITVGQIQTADHRLSLYQQAVRCGFEFPIIVARSAHVSRHASIGAGSIVMHGAVVNAGAKVGENCIINTRALIEHDTTVGDHCHISTGAILNGGVSVGAGSFVGSGCLIKQGVSIGRNCLVGIGLTVRYQLADGVRFFGDEKT